MVELTRTNQDPADDRVGRDSGGIDRRTYLRLGATLGVGTMTGLFGMSSGARGGVRVDTMDDPAPDDWAVGGGSTYGTGINRSEATTVVGTRADLLAALSEATSGDVIYVEDGATIDLTGVASIGLADGVTLASGRGRDDSAGGLLYTEDYADPLFKVYGDGVRFSGLRVRGPRWDYFDPADVSPYAAEGIWLLGDDGEVDNCQLYGWPHAAVSVGARRRVVSAHIHHCSIHHNAMEGLGYGINLYNGHSLIEHTYFDVNRHSISAFGHETSGYEARFNLVGPSPISHAFDVHNLAENVDGGYVAGGTIHIHHNNFQFTHDTLDRAQEAVTVRGVPANWATVEKNWFYHPECPDDVDVDTNGQAFRQDNLDVDDWVRFTFGANHYGTDEPCSDVGCPRPTRTVEGRAVDPTDGAILARSGVSFPYHNRFVERMTVTELSIASGTGHVASLADPSYDAGRWASEVHADADIQDGTTDVGGGVTLPGTIDLDADGHSTSPDTEPILSADSSADFALYEFRDDGGASYDMGGESLSVQVAYALDGGQSGVDRFEVAIPQSGDLVVGSARSVDPANTGARSGVALDVTNRYGQELTITDVGVAPSSGKISRLSDPSYETGQWTSEVHVSGDVVEGVCDIAGGTSLPGSIALGSDGFSGTVSHEPVLSGASGATISFYEFRKRNGRSIDMTGEDLAVTISYRLADGTNERKRVTVTPTPS